MQALVCHLGLAPSWRPLRLTTITSIPHKRKYSRKFTRRMPWTRNAVYIPYYKAKTTRISTCSFSTSTRSLKKASKQPQSGPIFAIIKQYTVHSSNPESSASTTSSIESVGKPSHSNSKTSNRDKSPSSALNNDYKSDKSKNTANAKVANNMPPKSEVSDIDVFVAAPHDMHSAPDWQIPTSHGPNHAFLTKNLVHFGHGSRIERIVRNHGLAALSYHQASDIVHEANGFKRILRSPDSESPLDLDQFKLNAETSGFSKSQFPLSSLPPEQSLRTKQLRSLWNVVTSAFLPTGFPRSVSSDYAGHYKWLWFQNVAGSFSYVMTMTALLHAVGVSSGALGISAAVSWIMKDGLGTLGMMFAAKVLGDANTFDANTIRSKFRADIMHNFGVSLELLTLLFPASFLLLASVANTFKGIAGLISGACKASINQRMAIANNLGDVTAKGHVQGLTAYLMGLMLGAIHDITSPYVLELLGPSFTTHMTSLLGALGVDATLTSNLPSASIALIMPTFFVAVVAHLTCSYFALRALALPSLNQARAFLLISRYLVANPMFDIQHQVKRNHHSTHDLSARRDLIPPALGLENNNTEAPQINSTSLPSPYELSKEGAENIIFANPLNRPPHIILGASIEQAFSARPAALQPLILRTGNAPYIVHGDDAGKKIWVVLNSEISTRQMLKCFFHACTARNILTSRHLTAEQLWHDLDMCIDVKEYVDREYPKFESQIAKLGWRLDQILLTPKHFRAEWTLAYPPK